MFESGVAILPKYITLVYWKIVLPGFMVFYYICLTGVVFVFVKRKFKQRW